MKARAPTGRDWRRVGALVLLAIVLGVSAVAWGTGQPAGRWTLTVVAACIAMLAAHPFVATNEEHTTVIDAGSLAVMVGLVGLAPEQVLVAVVLGHAVGWIAIRRREGGVLRTWFVVLKLTATLATNVILGSVAILVFALLAPASPLAWVLAAVASVSLAEVVSSAALATAVGAPLRLSLWQPANNLVREPIVGAGVALGGLCVAIAVLGGPAEASLLAATVGLWFVWRTHNADLGELAQLRAFVDVTQQLPPDTDSARVRDVLVERARQLTHASHAAIGSAPPGDADLGVPIDGGDWLTVGGHVGDADQFTHRDRRALDGLAALGRLALRTANLTDELRRAATHDELTGLLSRAGLEQHWSDVDARARRTGQGVGIVYIDLDRFKWVNDMFGHAAGDAVLREVADCLAGMARGGDLVARMGGDEFLVVAEGVKDEAAVDALVHRVTSGLATVQCPDGTPVVASIGGVPHAGGVADLEAAIRIADQRMYRTKHAIRGAD